MHGRRRPTGLESPTDRGEETDFRGSLKSQLTRADIGLSALEANQPNTGEGYFLIVRAPPISLHLPPSGMNAFRSPFSDAMAAEVTRMQLMEYDDRMMRARDRLRKSMLENNDKYKLSEIPPFRSGSKDAQGGASAASVVEKDEVLTQEMDDGGALILFKEGWIRLNRDEYARWKLSNVKKQ